MKKIILPTTLARFFIESWRFLGISILIIQLIGGIASADIGGFGEGNGISKGGSFVHEIPIDLPAGANGMKPELALTYDSAHGDGLLGMGWELKGFPVVSRDKRYGVNFNQNDHYVYNGRLFQNSAGLYQHEFEDYARIQAFNLNSPSSSWQITEKSGRKLFFGSSPDSNIGAVGQNGNALLWALSKVQDTFGNYCQYNYNQDPANGAYYPSQITWAQNATNTISATHMVYLYYENRPDVVPQYVPTFYAVNKRLNRIDIMENGLLLRRVNLTYETSPMTGRSRLIKVQQFGADGTSSLPPVTFNYINSQKGWQLDPNTTMPAPFRQVLNPTHVSSLNLQLENSNQYYSNIYNTYNDSGLLIADLNGDGRPDLLYGYKPSDGTPLKMGSWLSKTGGLTNSANYQPPISMEQGNPCTTTNINVGMAMADLDGDGLPDIVQSASIDGAIINNVWLNSGTGWSAPSTGANWKLPGYMVAASSSPVGMAWNTPVYTSFIDLNNDGRVDLVQANDFGSLSSQVSAQGVWLNSGSGWQLDARWKMPVNFFTFHIDISWPGNEYAIDNGVKLVDVNGDGYPDILQACNVQGNNGTRKCWLNTGSGWQANSTWTPPTDFIYSFDFGGSYLPSRFLSADAGARIVDLNGDGRPDIIKGFDCSSGFGPLLGYNGEHSAWLNSGTGWVNCPGYAPPVAFCRFLNNYYGQSSNGGPVAAVLDLGVRIMDVNGDGLPDLVQALDEGTTQTRHAWINTGSGWQQDDSWAPVEAFVVRAQVWDYEEAGVRAIDLDGKGTPDLAKSINWFGCAPLQQDFYRNRCSNANDLLQQVQTSEGGTIIVSYSPAALCAGAISSAGSKFPVVADVSARQLVTQIYYYDGLGEGHSRSYKYTNGRVMKGPSYAIRNLGFSTIQRTDDATGNYTVTTYRQDFPFEGCIASDCNFDNQGNLYTKDCYSYAQRHDAGSPAEVIFAYRNGSDEYLYDGVPTCVHKHSDYTYDGYGNVTRIVDHGWDTLAKDEIQTDRTFAYNTTAWILDRPIQETLSGYDSKLNWTIQSQKQWSYDNLSTGVGNTGGVTKTVVKNNQGADLVATCGYDKWGNLAWIQDGRVNAAEYSGTTSFKVYDPQFHAYPAQTYNAMGQMTQTFYDRLMRPVQVQDPNGLSTFTDYDLFSRPVAQYRWPDTKASPTVTWQYLLTGKAPGCQIVNSSMQPESSGMVQTCAYYDGLSNLIQKKRQAGTVGQSICEDSFYNASGKVAQKTTPYFSSNIGYTARNATKPSKFYLYDAELKPTRIVNPDGTTSNIIHAHDWTYTVDVAGHVHGERVDGHGRTLESDDFTGIYPNHKLYAGSLFQYDTATGNLNTFTDPTGLVTTCRYDLAGRKISMTDPDMGTLQFGYDANNNLVSSQDALGDTITKTFDPLNRLSATHYPTGASDTFYYDETGHGYSLGRFTHAVYSTNGNESFTYDLRGRVTQDTITIVGQTRTKSYSYDSRDQVLTAQYPDGETVTNGYNLAGDMCSLTGTTAYVTKVLYNANAKVAELDYANGIANYFDYYDNVGAIDPVSNLRYTYRLMNIRTVPSVHSLTYYYDVSGNVRGRYDNLTSDNSEFYEYDDLNRLVLAISPSYGNQQFSYAQNGCILSMKGHNYTYIPGTHQVGSDGVSTYIYNANGCRINRSQPTPMQYTYDNNNMLTGVPGLSSYAYFGGNRVLKNEGGAIVRYFFSDYDEQTDSTGINRTKYLQVDGKKVVKNSSREGIHYFLVDHLDSSIKMTDKTGNVVFKLGYQPYGSESFSTPIGPTPPSVRYLFTGKEQDQTGLYYYGARFYDPLVGRFISPDTTVPGGGKDSQQVDRYGYSRNNPIRYFDPTGHDSWDSQGCSEEWTNASTESIDPADTDPVEILSSLGKKAISNDASKSTDETQNQTRGDDDAAFEDILSTARAQLETQLKEQQRDFMTLFNEGLNQDDGGGGTNTGLSLPQSNLQVTSQKSELDGRGPVSSSLSSHAIENLGGIKIPAWLDISVSVKDPVTGIGVGVDGEGAPWAGVKQEIEFNSLTSVKLNANGNPLDGSSQLKAGLSVGYEGIGNVNGSLGFGAPAANNPNNPSNQNKNLNRVHDIFAGFWWGYSTASKSDSGSAAIGYTPGSENGFWNLIGSGAQKKDGYNFIK